MASICTVGQINTYIKNMFKQDFVLNKVSIRGEISNCKYHTSGHVYFTLKDSTGTIACVLFAGNAKGLSFKLDNGMQVVASGRVDVYERDGKYQLYVTSVQADGVGNLYQRFEELKNELEQMGMFSPEYKRKIPRFATKIGIVTAPTGAAIQDMINVSSRRNPYVQLILYPAYVQGELAKHSIVKGIRTLDRMGLDVIIVGRGGGSIEDLWAFNEEVVARAIFDASTPIISAVGHETDFTIADFVSDLRAPTPSAAAELAVTSMQEINELFYSYMERLNRTMLGKIDVYRTRLEKINLKLDFLNPVNRLNDQRQLSIEYEQRLNRAITFVLENYRHKMAIYAEHLNGVSPLRAMSNGYAFVENMSGNPIHVVDDLNVGDDVKICLKDGSLIANITKKERGVIDGKDDD